MGLEHAISARIADATEQFRVGQVSGIVGTHLTIALSGGTYTVPRLATWTPTVGDLVLIARTPAGWIALGNITP